MVKTLFPLICIALASSLQSDTVARESLASLVIVRSGLPQGCQLPPHVSVNGKEVTITGASIPDNPWTGDDSTVISRILQTVDSPPAVPDGPPPDLRTVRILSLERARKISEGAAAIYDSGRGLISIYAFRYRDAADLGPDSSVRTPAADTFELRRGALRIVMLGNGSECSLALARHVRSHAR